MEVKCMEVLWEDRQSVQYLRIRSYNLRYSQIRAGAALLGLIVQTFLEHKCQLEAPCALRSMLGAQPA